MNKLQKLFLLFRSIDRCSLFPACRVLMYYTLFHLSRNRRALCERWQNRDVVLSFSGIKFSVNAVPGDLGCIFEVFVLRTYESAPSFLPRPGDVCIDIGANIGTNVLNWYRHNPAGRIIGLEPHPQIVQRLNRNIALNRCANVEVFPFAVSDQNGQLEMYTDEGSTMLVAGDARKSRKHVIKAVTLDTLVQTLGVRTIDLCKIDVEGHEAAVLKGASGSLPMIRRLVIEYHSEALRDSVKALLADRFSLVSEIAAGPYGLLFAVNTGLPKRE